MIAGRGGGTLSVHGATGSRLDGNEGFAHYLGVDCFTSLKNIGSKEMQCVSPY